MPREIDGMSLPPFGQDVSRRIHIFDVDPIPSSEGSRGLVQGTVLNESGYAGAQFAVRSRRGFFSGTTFVG